MKTVLRTLCILALIAVMGAAAVPAEQNGPAATVSSEYGISSAPVACGSGNAVAPIVVAANSAPCPGKVYCNNPNTSCGAYCCEWGYFYSNSCDCRCYRSSYDAGAKCSSYFRCN